MTDRPVSLDLFRPGSVPPELWEEITSSLNEAALQGAEVVQLHMGAVIQRARLVVFRTVHQGAAGGTAMAYGWGATLILTTRVEPGVLVESARDHFVEDDQAEHPQEAVSRWVQDLAVEHFLGVTRVDGWQTQRFAHGVLRGAETTSDSARLARQIAGAADQALARLRGDGGASG
ncbi:MAG TPA: hypothetical protein VFN57_11135 [Thermomicrobiaceae bacterium]|nr:hypothetical protein [Thermomicrobiaceae bacterium]